MIEISEKLNIYRECARNIWNNYFLRQMTKHNEFDLKDEFDDLCVMLFSSLILHPLGCISYRKPPSYKPYPKPLNFLVVVPSAKSGVPILVNRDSRRSGYWDYPVDFVIPSEVELRFIDCYDFGQYQFRDFEYYAVRIVNSTKHKDIIGRDALIEPTCAKIYFDKKQAENKNYSKRR